MADEKSNEKPEQRTEEGPVPAGAEKPPLLKRIRAMIAPPRRPEVRPQKPPAEKQEGDPAASGKPAGESPTAETKSLGEKAIGRVPGLGGTRTPEPDLPGRIDGLRGWLEEIERRQGRMTWFGAAAMLIALVASGAALYLGVKSNQDSASKDDLDEVRTEISQLRTELERSNAQKLQSVTQQLTSLQQQLKTVQTKQNQQAKDITELKQRPVPTPTPPSTTTQQNQNQNEKQNP